jgi:hypothetical protein
MEKKPMGNFFKLNALKRKGLSWGERDKGIALTMFFERATCPWRKGLSCLGEQFH